jgi:hypothetical protein
MLYEVTTFLWLLLISSLLFQVSKELLEVTCFLLPALTCLLIFGSYEAIIITQWAQQGQITQDQVPELLSSLDVTDGETFGLRTTSHKGIKGSRPGRTGVITLPRGDINGLRTALAILQGW